MTDQSSRPQHYFTPEPQGPSAPRRIEVTIRGLPLALWTDRGVFSYGELDRGTRLLAETVQLPAQGEVLDWGAGYGVLGIVCAQLCPQCRVTMVEINERAAALAQRNIELAGVTNATVITGEAPAVLGAQDFDAILSNPPLHVGKAAVETIIHEARRRLRPDGELWLVVPTKKGAKGFLDLMARLFAKTEIVTISGGFRILRGVQGSGNGVTA